MATDSNWPKEPYSTILPFPQNTILKDCTTLNLTKGLPYVHILLMGTYFHGFEALTEEKNFAWVYKVWKA